MALIQKKQGPMTTDTLVEKPLFCHSCRQHKAGPFTVSSDNKPMCADCSAAIGKPII